jgi:hypothetical protein
MQHKSTEEYSAKQCKQHKVEINRVVAKRAQQLQVDVQAFHALFLDSIEAGTASELKRGGFMECNLHIPNICPEVCASLQQRLPTADVYPGSVHDYLQTFKQQHHLIYFDYCCTYDGNQHTDPLSDMDSMFNHGHLAEKCIVAHTFNKRGYSNEAAVHAEGKIMRSLHHAALQNGYTCCLHEKLAYGNMVFLLHSCFKLAIASQALSLSADSLFDPISTFQGQYEATTTGVIPDQPYRLGKSQTAMRSLTLKTTLVGSTVWVCWEMSTDDGAATFKQWFDGRVVRKIARDEYMVDYKQDGIQSTMLRRKAYSARKAAEVGAWFIVNDK